MKSLDVREWDIELPEQGYDAGVHIRGWVYREKLFAAANTRGYRRLEGLEGAKLLRLRGESLQMQERGSMRPLGMFPRRSERMANHSRRMAHRRPIKVRPLMGAHPARSSFLNSRSAIKASDCTLKRTGLKCSKHAHNPDRSLHAVRFLLRNRPL